MPLSLVSLWLSVTPKIDATLPVVDEEVPFELLILEDVFDDDDDDITTPPLSLAFRGVRGL